MKKQPDLEFQKLLGMIRSHFDFLFQRGYRIVSAMFTDPANQDWNVIVAGKDTLIQIRYRNKKVNLALSSEKLFDTVGMLDLYDLVGHIRGEKNLLEASPPLLPDEREQVRKSAQLLENHMEEILTFLQKIHSSASFSIAGELSVDNSPACLFRGPEKAAYAAPA